MYCDGSDTVPSSTPRSPTPTDESINYEVPHSPPRSPTPTDESTNYEGPYSTPRSPTPTVESINYQVGPYSTPRSPTPTNESTNYEVAYSTPKSPTPTNESTGDEYEDHNKPDRYGNVPLHIAVIQQDEEMLSNLLQHKSIDLNVKNDMGKTPLLLAIERMRQSYSFIMQLIHSGADLNATNELGQNSVHTALRCCCDYNILHELIKNGADINAQDRDRRTPLHYAIKDYNLEAVCMLLCYGADVSIVNDENKTPFSLALCYDRSRITEVLFDYYDDFSEPDSKGYTALHFAILQGHPIALDLLKAGADVNCITYDNQNLFVMCLENGSMELFELICSKFNFHLLLNAEIPVLRTFTKSVGLFGPNKWLKAMYSVLNCPVAFELLDKSRPLFSDVIFIFRSFEIKLCDRLNIISAILSLGAEINMFDINLVLILYGFNEELEMFLYCSDYYVQHSNFLVIPQCSFIFSIDDPSIKTVIQLFKNFLDDMDCYTANDKILENCALINLGFFSMSSDQKLDLCNHYMSSMYYLPAVIDKINALPEFPSLLELSRNQARKFIMQTFKITKAYQFHDLVKKLKLPYRIQNILRFKTPLY